ncbi:hypothetical protein NM208_g5572 [Fusarium decemcellulare]|uniref:Uncharacterized protein n=1 Tax=Fusarium decemcellulare TaxID=57161 RepID=A0ACC1SGS7_9HYPO|nr:hypothetical protein NM208_g5572 [Fusarium decemcellulare]
MANDARPQGGRDGAVREKKGPDAPASPSPALESAEPSNQPDSTPYGGERLWLIVLCSHFVVMNTWGFINSFGAIQTYLTESLQRRPSEISWIGSIQVFLLFFMGTFTGRFTDAGYFGPIFITGIVSMVAGILSSSFCSQYWQYFLSLGIAVGFANGCLFCPMLTVMSAYFTKNRSFAIGLASCGSATGGIVYPVIARQLIPSIGFPWAMRAMTLVQLVLLVVSAAILRPRTQVKQSGSFIDRAAFQELSYSFYAIGSFFCLLSLYFSFFYLSSFSRTAIHPSFSYSDSLNLLLLLNGIGVLGRVAVSYLADRMGVINVFILTAAAASLILFLWTTVHDFVGTYIWAVFCGTASGAVQSLFPAGLTFLAMHDTKLGTRIGMVFTIVAFASLVCPPIGGSIIRAMGGRYLGAQLFAGSTMLLCTCFMVAVRAAMSKKRSDVVKPVS